MEAYLQRQNDERDEVDRAQRDEIAPLSEDDVREMLRDGRFVRELRDFQLRDLGRVLSLTHGANFSVPGAGKTTVAYACYEAERRRGRVDRLLVVAPLSAYDAWIGEATRCFDRPPIVSRIERRTHATEVSLVNYHRLVAQFATVAEWVTDRPTHVILDEAHRMKRGRNGEWGAACLDLAQLAVRRDILTGTPAPQHPMDFVALMEFLWPSQSNRILPAGTRDPDPGPLVMRAISRRLAPLFVRTRKDELGLDDPILRVEMVEMKPVQAQVYDALRVRMRRVARGGARERATLADLGGIVMYLLEAASNPALLARAVGAEYGARRWPPDPLPPGSPITQLVADYATLEMPRKFEKVAALVAANAADGRKTLVWSNFVANLTDLATSVLAPHQPALIYGAIPSAEDDGAALTREGELRRFRHDDACTVLLANPAAMSEGVSLHETCHDAIYIDRTFNAGQYLQSLDRIHRLGLPSGTETTITLMVSQGTIDETVDGRVRLKASRLAQMLSDPNLVTMALPDEEGYGEWIDVDDVDALFAHLDHGG